MNQEQIADFCCRYFTATNCQLIEKSPSHLKVKLSPEADRDLTGRPYYWNFVERTGADPETMSFMFIFDPEKREKENNKAQAGTDSSILGRYFNMPPILPQPGRMLEETVVFGTRRLEQIFSSASDKGAYLQLFEEPPLLPSGAPVSIPYSTWLGVNYKVSYICDMKREEMYSLGICMSTGEISADFYRMMQARRLSPRIPAHTTLRESITLVRAVQALEQYIEARLRTADYTWAVEASNRMREELERIDRYYGDMLRAAAIEDEERQIIRSQYDKRKEEIHWQYQPGVEAVPINCGFFHLLTDTLRPH